MTIRIRRGTAASAAGNNPVLADGEIATETDTGVVKVGDGVTPWKDLPPHKCLVNEASGDVRYTKRGDLFLNVKDYGAKGDGTANDTAAVQAAIDAAGSSSFGGVVYFPAGQYQISATLNITKNNVRLVGIGGNGSRIAVTGDFDAISFASGLTSCGIQDLWVGSFSARAAGWGIKINGSSASQPAYLTLSNVVVQNTYGGIWASYVQQSVWSGIRITKSFAGGITDYGMYFIGCKSMRLRAFYVNGAAGGKTGKDGILFDSDCDTVLLSDGEVLNAGGDGIRFTNSVGGTMTGPRLIHMTRVLIETCAGAGYNLATGRYAKLTQCWASANSGDGYLVGAIDGADLTTCEANQNGQHGFHFTGGTGPFSAVNCNANFNSQSADNTYNGFQVDAGTSNLRIADSRSGNWLLGLANGQKYGARLEASGVTVTTMQGNTFVGNKTNPVSNLSQSASNRMMNNSGYNPVGMATIPIPTTGVGYVNTIGVHLTAYIKGGTVSSIFIGGVDTGMTSGLFRIPAGQSIVINYTVAPTWVVFGE